MIADIPTRLESQQLAVSTHALSKRYGKQFALREVDVTVPEGSFYVLVGPNGSGKTTLLKLLLEIIHPTSGEIEVLGARVPQRGAQVRASVGYVSERGDDLYTWMDVRTALDQHSRYYSAWDASYAAQLIERLQIKQGKLSKLSKGEARRVQIVMALAHRPPLLLLDEPTDGLDPVGREIFLSILAEHIATSPTTVVVSTHLIFELERLADHFAVMRDGKLLAQTSTDYMKRRLKKYVVRGAGSIEPAPPAGALLVANGNPRERAWTLWGEEAALAAKIEQSGGEVHEVRSLTLQEAAVAFLSGGTL
ncbi:MAG TPA: ABC transporter ATP-binding protein [Longimicrobiales bacterium]